jgi:hypothetical protein
MPGHVGVMYQASNAVYTGRGTARTLALLPDGSVFSDCVQQKIRARERGHEYAERRLVGLGARSPRPARTPAAWLARPCQQRAHGRSGIRVTTGTHSASEPAAASGRT